MIYYNIHGRRSTYKIPDESSGKFQIHPVFPTSKENQHVCGVIKVILTKLKEILSTPIKCRVIHVSVLCYFFILQKHILLCAYFIGTFIP